jgi:tetratricopeptide (TPR) repeat protein
MRVANSFLCANCGIKVSEAEEYCPGCGQVPSMLNGQARSSAESASDDTAAGFEGSSFSNNHPIGNKSNQHLIDCEALFDKNKPYFDQPDVVEEVINRTKEVIKSDPDKESTNRLYAYVSEMYRMTYRYEESFAHAVFGVESSETFFKHQAHNSILDSLFNLNRFPEFETWVERALKDRFPDAQYFRMRYLTKLEKYDEALKICESHFDSNVVFANSNRASILVRAKRYEEAEQIFRKLIISGPRDEYVSNWINTLAFSILIPQGRLVEAESILVTSLSTHDNREKINSYSNLALVAFNFKEFNAAKRYARIASTHSDNAIASESRLTLCEIEFSQLNESKNSSISDWKDLFTKVKQGILAADIDDVPRFLSLLITCGTRSEESDQIIEIVESEYLKISKMPIWNFNKTIRIEFQRNRVELLSSKYLAESKFIELDELLINTIDELKNEKIESLLDYLRTPFAAIDLRRAALKSNNVEFLAEWASFEEQSEIIFGLAKHQDEPILVALAENQSSPDAVCELIASKNDMDLDFALCGRSNLSPRLAQVLSGSSFEAARKLIAIRDDLDNETYQKLATDQAQLVRDAIRENQSCSAEIRALAALGSL